jgi:hypothetical protein
MVLCWQVAKTQIFVPDQSFYFFDKFKSGTVFFENDQIAQAKFNYNLFSQRMEFFDPENEDRLLNLIVSPNLTHIEIEKTIFVPVEPTGFAVVVQDGPVTLLRKKRLFEELDKTRGGYEVPNSTAAVTNSASIYVGIQTVHGIGSHRLLPVSIATKTREEQRFYFMKNRVTYTASRRNFLRLYTEIRPQLEKFLKENKVDFKNEEHLRGITRYANSLLIAKERS